MTSRNATPPARQMTTMTKASMTYDIPYSTLAQWIREGRLPGYRVAGGRQVRIYVDDLEALFVRIGGG
jgi:excisionase family DNA binding protein